MTDVLLTWNSSTCISLGSGKGVMLYVTIPSFTQPLDPSTGR